MVRLAGNSLTQVNLGPNILCYISSNEVNSMAIRSQIVTKMTLQKERTKYLRRKTCIFFNKYLSSFNVLAIF